MKKKVFSSKMTKKFNFVTRKYSEKKVLLLLLSETLDKKKFSEEEN